MATSYRFGRVQIRPAEREVWVDGQPVALVGRAYDLLLVLIDHRDRVVTKDQLLDLVWPGLVVEENNLHTQVSAVRKIVGRAAIATIAGRGYRFVAPVVVVSMDAVPALSIQHFPERLPPSAPMPGAPGVAAAGRLSIAVLPFTNMSGDPEQEYFSDGITEDIITDLSKTTGLLVVARNSSFAYKHKGGDVRTVAIWRHDLALARAETDRALALNPNYALAYGIRGNVVVYLGTPLTGIPHIQRAIRLDPYFTHQTLLFLGTAQLVAANFEAAVATFRERIRLAPQTDLSRAFLASALGHLGAVDEARGGWSELTRINPAYSFAEHLARLPFRADADRNRIRDGVKKAGLSH